MLVEKYTFTPLIKRAEDRVSVELIMWVQTTDESKSGRMVFLWQQINIQRMWVRSDLCISIWGENDDDEKSRIKDQISKIKDQGSRMKDRGSRRRIPSQLKCIPWHSPQKNKWDFFFDNCIIQLIMCGYYLWVTFFLYPSPSHMYVHVRGWCWPRQSYQGEG